MRPVFKKLAAILMAAVTPTLAFSQGSDPFSVENLNKAPTTAWIATNGNLKGQRYVPLDQINKTNVANLKANWQFHMDGSGLGGQISNQGTPVFYDGILYTVTGQDDVFAIDIETGKSVWKYIANVPTADVTTCCGWVARGLGIGDGKIYVGRMDGKITALDIKTGKQVWEIQPVSNKDGYSITAAPLYYKDMIIIGYAGGEFGIRGKIEAFSSKDGHKLWTFWVIPGPGEKGHDTWPQDNDWWQYGGGSIWQTPVIDSETNTLYVSTGNPGPDLNGSARAGDNLFTASILALDPMNGQYKWHYQEVHHDIWDYDAPNPIILFDYTINGQLRHGLSQANKNGLNYVLDRTTGQPLIGIPEVAVPQMESQKTAATQPMPIGDSLVPVMMDTAPEGYVLINQGRVFTPFGAERVLYKPLAGINWPPPAYDPETNYAYYCGADRIGGGIQGRNPVQVPNDENGVRKRGQWTEGSFQSANSIPRIDLYIAQDLSTNRRVWASQLTTPCHSGGLITKGGLFIVGRDNGNVVAIDKSNGLQLWTFMTDAGVNGSPISFEWKGTQYVAVISAGSAFANNVKGDSVWLFSLNGTISPPPPPAPAGRGGPGGGAPGGARAGATAPAPGAPPAGAPAGGGRGPAAAPAAAVGEVTPPIGRTANLAAGETIYGQNCTQCHGAEALGSEGGPAIPKASTLAYIMTTATRGKAGGMPAFGRELTIEQIHDAANYITATLLPKHAN